jgi:hypothetical protein
LIAILRKLSDRRALFILILILIARRRARALSRVALGSRPAPGTPHSNSEQSSVHALRSDQSGHARGRITRGEALICTTDECHSAKSAAL